MAVTGFANGIKSADGAFSDGPVAATTTLYRMAIVMRDGSGNLINGATVAGAHGVGVAAYNDVAGTNSNVWDNSAGIAGAITAKYLIGIYGPFANSGTSITAGMEGKVCYCLDNVTVHATSNAGARSPAGVISRIDSSGVWVLFDENIVRALAAASGAGGSTWTQTYSTANRTVAAATDAALTDSTTGTAGASMAAGAGVQTLAIPITLASITANGDVANKIGTYQLAVNAMHHGVRFMVVAPSSTIDMNLASGDDIPIEERDGAELLEVGGKRVGADVEAFNPVFDVTPADLIDAIVTEKGIVERPDTAKMAQLMCRKRLH